MRVLGRLAGAAGVVAILTLLSRAMGLVRKLAQSWVMADTAVASAYDTANTVPNILFEVAAGGALAGAVVPVLSRFLSEGEHAQARRAASAIITWVLTVSLPLSALVVLAAKPITAVLLSGAEPASVELGATLLRMFAIQVPLYGISVVATGTLHSHGRFVIPALAPLLSSLVVITAFAAYGRVAPVLGDPGDLSTSAVALLGWGTTAGVVAFSLTQVGAAAKYLDLRPAWRLPGGSGKVIVKLGAAGLLALIAQQLAILAIMVFANRIGEVGTYATFNYAFAVFLVPYAVLAVPVATVTFPSIARATGAARAQLVASSTRLITSLGIAAAALLFALARPAQVVLGVGREIAGLDVAMRWMAPALIGYCLLYHGARVLYAAGRPRAVILANTAGWLTAVAVLMVGAAAGISGRTPTLQLIGAALSVGMGVGLLRILRSIRSVLEAPTGTARIAAFTLPVGLAAALVGRFIADSILAAAGQTIPAALAAAVVGFVAVCGPLAACIYAIDRPALRRLA